MKPKFIIQPRSVNRLETINYDAAREILELQFRGCGSYQFFGVSNGVYTRLMDASSHIEFFNRHIKGRYSTHFK